MDFGEDTIQDLTSLHTLSTSEKLAQWFCAVTRQRCPPSPSPSPSGPCCPRWETRGPRSRCGRWRVAMGRGALETQGRLAALSPGSRPVGGAGGQWGPSSLPPVFCKPAGPPAWPADPSLTACAASVRPPHAPSPAARWSSALVASPRDVPAPTLARQRPGLAWRAPSPPRSALVGVSPSPARTQPPRRARASRLLFCGRWGRRDSRLHAPQPGSDMSRATQHL